MARKGAWMLGRPLGVVALGWAWRSVREAAEVVRGLCLAGGGQFWAWRMGVVIGLLVFLGGGRQLGRGGCGGWEDGDWEAQLGSWRLWEWVVVDRMEGDGCSRLGGANG